MKQPVFETLTLDKIVGGGQTLGQLNNGKKAFVWGGLPGETVTIEVTKKKSGYVDGVVGEIIQSSTNRVTPRDATSYLSTSPWQIMDFDSEQHYKAALIEEAFELHDIVLPQPIEVYANSASYEYRNKVEFSWWWSLENSELDLAFFRRGTHGKIPVEGTSLARPEINHAAQKLRGLLRKKQVEARNLKTVIVRCNQAGDVIMQLYVKEADFEALADSELSSLGIRGFELIYSNPKSPASVITTRLQSWGQTTLTDTILGVPFTYVAEGFFQINLPVYEQALRDMREWVEIDKPTVDLYSGVGSIGLTIGGNNVTLIESNEHAVEEMKRNISAQHRQDTATAILAPSEKALEHITNDDCIIVDPPRAGLHEDVVARLLETRPRRIVYLSCNPVTQARDVARLAPGYGIRHHKGYNFFPRTPHIEHLVVLDLKKASS
ncbi:MAG TPA: TRAM domain-containing protein [Candidatus Saccharimonadales bacterium]